MSRFDERRNLQESTNEEQMCEVIRAQEEVINQLKAQLQQFQQQQQLQETQLQQHQQQFHSQNCLMMKPKDIIQQFRQIKPLHNNRNINGFIKSVEMIIGLCEGNAELIKYGIQIIINEKITADFGTYIRELGDISWEQLKAKLKIQARPRTSYAEVFNKCRYIKVSNLRELFDYFETAKYQISEMYELDDNKSMLYQSENVDRDLVNILIEKIDGPLRVHLDENLTLNDIMGRYTRLRLLDDSRAIDSRHRANKNFKINQIQNNNKTFANQVNRPQNFNEHNGKGKNCVGNESQHFHNYNNYNHNFNSVRPQYVDKRNNGQSQNSYNQPQNSFSRSRNYPIRNNNKPGSSQTRLSHMSVDTNLGSQRSHNAEYMEVDTLQEAGKFASNDEANFLEPPRNSNYP